ncbi:GNAT family N-acetyltransferase [Phreatobacter sp.]|uniref:GNAT family N-acetyltransferase n=1 Tax=Phreatobacter sp. TaxID=1966341 RepID=UPI0025F59A64|nr:GNAT family N-acetyltransferase [Phreatobacter sp.]
MTLISDLVFWWPRPDPVVGRATTADCDDLAAIHAASFHRGWGAEDLAAMLTEASVIAHVIRRRPAASPAGFILSRIAGDEAEILTVAVAPRLRGRGYAGRLIAAHLPDLMRAGVRTLFLEVEAENAAALKLYARTGFEPVGRRKAYYRTAQGAADALTMRRLLPAI